MIIRHDYFNRQRKTFGETTDFKGYKHMNISEPVSGKDKMVLQFTSYLRALSLLPTLCLLGTLSLALGKAPNRDTYTINSTGQLPGGSSAKSK